MLVLYNISGQCSVIQMNSFQFSKGGPIIAFQVENEYGSFGHSSDYMQHLKKVEAS